MSRSGLRRSDPVSIPGTKKPSVRLIANRSAEVAHWVRCSLQRAIRDLRQQSVAVGVVETESAQDCEHESEAAVRNNCSAVVAVGGDGTLHHVVNGVMKASGGRRSETASSMIPAGTANDFAQSLGIGPRDAYRVLISSGEGRSTVVDLGRVRSNNTASESGSSQYIFNQKADIEDRVSGQEQTSWVGTQPT